MANSTPRPHFTPGKNPVPILQEVGWALGPVWTGGKKLSYRDSTPDRPARSRCYMKNSYVLISNQTSYIYHILPTYIVKKYVYEKQVIMYRIIMLFVVCRAENLGPSS